MRWLLVFAAAVLIGGLGAAAWVQPDHRGFGTHEHLGLGPCTFRLLFNRPCPSCGMTTSWALVVHGQLLRAFEANAGGTLLALTAVLVMPWLLVSAAVGRWLFRPPSGHWIAVGVSCTALVTLLQWLVRLASGPA